jgi:hypothetical protein
MDNFWNGFEKQAKVDGEKVLGGLLGALYGFGAGTILGELGSAPFIDRNHKKFQEALKEKKKENVDAKKIFKKIKPALPDGSKHYTRSDLKKMKPKNPGAIEKHLYEHFDEQLGQGNAFAVNGEQNKNLKHLPQFLKEKAIVTGDKVHPSIMVHEAGHLIDFDETDKKTFLKRVYDKHLRSTLKMENQAWDKAPGEYDDKIKDTALSTYEARHAGKVIGSLLGILGGGYLGMKHL